MEEIQNEKTSSNVRAVRVQVARDGIHSCFIEHS